MKILMMLMVAVFTAGFTTPANAQIESLKTLISKGIVTASFKGTGISRGACIRLTLRKKAGAKSLTVSLLPGTTIEYDGKPAFEMVIGRIIGRVAGANRVVPASEIMIPDERPVTYILDAYPTGKPQSALTSSGHFTIKGWDSALGCMLVTAHDLRVSERSTQAAIWMYSEVAEAAIRGDTMPGPGPDPARKWLPMTDEEWQLGGSIVAHCIIGP